MKTWRPASWNQQAREMCDRQVEYINAGHALVEDAPSLRQFLQSTNHHRQGGEEIWQTYESRKG